MTNNAPIIIAAACANMQYPIGTTFTEVRGRGKRRIKREQEVIDYCFKYNSEGLLVASRYVIAHTLMGQRVVGMCGAYTIARNLHREGEV